MGLSLTVLGCSGSYAAADNSCSGYLVRGGGVTVWLDCGPGTLAALQRHATLAEIDAVVVSHSHPDHMAELPVVRNAWKYYEERPPVPVYTTADVRRLTELISGEPTEPTLEWHVVESGDRVQIGDLSVSFSATNHHVETLGARFDADGASLAYSADTGPDWSLEALGPGLDLALCEASLLARDEGRALHLSGRQAGASASAAGVGRLVLTHIPPTSEPAVHLREASEAFDGRIDMAAPHVRYDL